MSKRHFHDSKGVAWDVWDVRPSDAMIRGYDRRGESRDPVVSDLPIPIKPTLDPGLEEGWLCFQTGHERRRFAPIPPGWVELPDAVLRVMLDIANPVAGRAEHAEYRAKPAES